MKTLVNLAKDPFRNRRLFWLSVLAVFVGASWFGLSALERLNKLKEEIGGREDQVRQIEAKSKKIAPAKPTSELVITADKNRELLAAADLIERRAFSWSQLLNAIERHIPPTVRVFRIAVNNIRPKQQAGTVGDDEDRTVSLTLEVMGKTVGDVTKMITDFERSGYFVVNPRETKMEETGEVSFILEVEYSPPRLPRPRNDRMLGSSLAPVKLVSLRQPLSGR